MKNDAKEEVVTCWFCNQPTGTSHPVCDSAKCRGYEHEYNQSMDDWERHLVKEGLRESIKQRCKFDEEWELNRLQRWFYTLKLLVCILLKRRYYQGPKTFPDAVDVGIFDQQPALSTYEESFRIMQVGHGYFTGWWWDIEIN